MSSIVAVVPDKMVYELWWVGVIQALLALFFGISALFWPGLSLITLVYLFSSFILALGLLETIAGLMSIRRRGSWWLTLLIGLIGVGSGIYLIRHPEVSFATFILIVGLVLIVRGLLDVARALLDNDSVPVKTLFMILGVSAVVAGILILKQPVAGGVAFVWILGLYALTLGVIAMVAALEVRADSLLLPDESRPRLKKEGVR